jgi:uncharacterized protein (TIRG00374 family)
MSRRRRLLVGLLGVVISVASLVVLSGMVDLRAALELFRRTDPLPIVVALGVIVAELMLRSFRWSILLAGRDEPRIPTARLTPVLLIGYLGNTALPARLGELVRAYLVTLRERVSFDRSLGTVLLERVLDLASLAVVATIAAWLAGAPAWLTQLTALAAVGGLAAIVLLVAIGIPRIVDWLGRVLGRSSAVVARALVFLRRFGEGAGGQARATIGAAIGISALCWVLDGSIFWLMGRAVGADLPWPSAVLMAGVTVLATAIPSAPGYLGTFELAAVAAAEAVGVPGDQAFAVALLAHAITVLPLALGGVLALGGMSMSIGTIASEAIDRRRAS